MRKQKFFKRAAAIGTVVVLGCSMSGCGTEVSSDKNMVKESSASKDEEKLVETMNRFTGIKNSDSKASDKEETVYVMADNSGNPTEIIVSERLKNNEGSNTIEDKTKLTDIKNVKGDEDFSNSGSNIKWNANGSDIYYQGKSNEKLPVEVKVSYYLDGKQVSAESLAGKSGNIKIRYDYSNNSMTSATINGKKENIYTPFVMATGLMLPTDRFTNVSVSNGDVISEGNNMIVVGMAMPGLSDNLALDDMKNVKDDIEIPDYFEVTADVVDFSLGMSVTFCSNTLIDMGNIMENVNTDDINADIDELTDGSNQLKDGAQKLYDGTTELKDGTNELSGGVSQLADGVKEYTDGVSAANDGVNQLKEGSVKLDDGAQSLVDGLVAAKDGAQPLLDGLQSAKDGSAKLKDGLENAKSGSTQLKEGLEGANSGSKQLKDGAVSLKDGSTQLKEGLGKLNSSAPALVSGIAAAKNGISIIVEGYEGTETTPGALDGAKAVSEGIAQLNEQVKNLNLPDMTEQSASLTDEQKELIKQQITDYLDSDGSVQVAAATTSFITNVEGLMTANGVTLDAQTQEVLESVISGVFKEAFANVYVSAYETGMEKGMSEVSSEVSAQLNAFAPMITQLQTVTDQLASGSAAVTDGVNQLYAGTKQLSEGINTMYDSAKSLPDGVSQLYNGSVSLEDGAKQLYDGTSSLNAGTNQLYDGSKTLDNGMSQLLDGSKSLDDGLTQLNDGGKRLSTGLVQLNDGAVSLKAGTYAAKKGVEDLSDGTTKLVNATGRIKNGFVDLRAGVIKLNDGAQQLNSGALELKDGMVKLNDEGISKLNSLVKDDVNGLVDRLNAVSEANDSYTLYGGIADGKSGKEKIIIKIEGIGD